MQSVLSRVWNSVVDAMISVILLILPDVLIRSACAWSLQDRLNQLNLLNSDILQATLAHKDAKQKQHDRAFVAEMEKAVSEQKLVAVDSDAAKQQHYEVPTPFFLKCLGPHLKYSSCLFHPSTTSSSSSSTSSSASVAAASFSFPSFPSPHFFSPSSVQYSLSLAHAEVAAFEFYSHLVSFATLPAGSEVLEIGMGWGSCCLYFARQFPQLRFTALSHSRTQREYVQQKANQLQLNNLRVLLHNVNVPLTTLFQASSSSSSSLQRFRVIYSIECFEHIRGIKSVLQQLRELLQDDGRLLVHTFVHQHANYIFEDNSWMGRQFFTGGMMPSSTLYTTIGEDIGLQLVKHESWNGKHYEQTSELWLREMYANRWSIIRALGGFNLIDGMLQFQRWRLFYLAVCVCFGMNQGQEWFVDVKLFSKAKIPTSS